MRKTAVIFLLALGLMNMATTYVVKEGGKEVGRYEENDGKADVVEVANAARPSDRNTKSAAPAAAHDVWGKRPSEQQPLSNENPFQKYDEQIAQEMQDSFRTTARVQAAKADMAKDR